MSRATVRAACAAYFTPGTVAGLNTIYTSFPKRIPGPAFRNGQPAGTKSGAAGVIHIDSETEERRAIGGAFNGKKWVHYTVELQVFCHSLELHSENAMDFFDSVIDNIKTKLRADRTLNDYPVIFEAGEEQLDGIYGEPVVLNDGATEIWGAVKFVVSEFLNA
jgi:hypothetical protein